MCPLCSFPVNAFYKDKKREFNHCENCDLISVPQRYHLSPFQEKEQYDFHENDPADAGYRDFLGRIIDPLEMHLTQGMTGLDFGSGPGPTLHTMLEARGFSMEHYDPFYADDSALLKRRYDFVTSTEVVEHFNDPNRSWGILSGLVRSEGILAVMTLFWNNSTKENFKNWWYKNNQTHVVFYSLNTLRWIEARYGLCLIYSDIRTAIFRKV